MERVVFEIEIMKGLELWLTITFLGIGYWDDGWCWVEDKISVVKLRNWEVLGMELLFIWLLKLVRFMVGIVLEKMIVKEVFRNKEK